MNPRCRASWRKRVVTILAALTMVGSIVACSTIGEDGDQALSVEERSTQQRIGLLRAAEEAGVDQSQISVLQQDEISFDDYSSAVDRSLQCMRDAGLIVDGPRVINRQGQEEITYSASMGADGTSTIMENCVQRYSHFVEWFWQSGSPAAIGFVADLEARFLEPVRICLDELGIDYPANPTWQDIEGPAVQQALNGPGEPCLTTTGFDDAAAQ